MSSSTLEWVGTAAMGAGAGAYIGATLFTLTRSAVRRRRLASWATRRSWVAMTVATDAALDKRAFEPAEILASVDEILEILATLWARDAEVPGDRRPDLAVISGWAESVAEGLGDAVRLVGSEVAVLRVVSRPDEREDRVVLQVKLRLRVPKGRTLGLASPKVLHSDLRWTLGRAGAGWRLLTIDSAELSEEALEAPLVAGAWADEDRLWEEALAELAEADGPAGFDHLPGLVNSDATADQQLSELALIDRRFDRELVQARLRRIVEAWEETSNGAGDLLLDVAAPDALKMLLHGPASDQRVRLILHDAALDHWRTLELVLSDAPTLRVAVVVSAVRYLIWHETGRWASGTTERRHRISLEWTLTIAPHPGARWRLTSTTSPIAPPIDDASPPRPDLLLRRAEKDHAKGQGRSGSEEGSSRGHP